MKKLLNLSLALLLLGSCQKHEIENVTKASSSLPETTSAKVLDGCHPGEDLRILFIGNSFTANYTVDIPTMVGDLINANGESIGLISTRANLGWNLGDHLNSGSTLAAINSGNWDFVILQENSGDLSFNGQSAANAFISRVQTLNNIILQQSPDAKVLLYQVVPSVEENTATYNNLHASFTTTHATAAAQASNIFVVNIAEAFTQAYNGVGGYNPNPDPLRYSSTYQHHFQNSGGFLAAVTFFSSIYGYTPTIPTTMNFFNGSSNSYLPVNVYVSQPSILVGIGNGVGSHAVLPVSCFVDGEPGEGGGGTQG